MVVCPCCTKGAIQCVCFNEHVDIGNPKRQKYNDEIVVSANWKVTRTQTVQIVREESQEFDAGFSVFVATHTVHGNCGFLSSMASRILS